MIIAMEQGMDRLSLQLKQKGHVVVPLYGYEKGVDAVVYKEADILEVSSGLQNFANEEQGILMICGRHMTDEEICRTLETKSFGSIF